jgi:hypothetical protein
MSFEIGQPVEVLDPGLAQLRAILAQTGEVVVNHHGWVHDVEPDGTVIVEFPIGDDDPNSHSQIAPYPPHMVRAR